MIPSNSLSLLRSTTTGGTSSSLDIFLRLQESRGVLKVSQYPTAAIRAPVEILVNDCKALGQVIHSMRRASEYQTLYLSHVMGSLSEDEFENESRQFICDVVDLSVSALAPKVGALLRWVPQVEFTVDDISQIFQVSYESALTAAEHSAQRTPNEFALGSSSEVE